METGLFFAEQFFPTHESGNPLRRALLSVPFLDPEARLLADRPPLKPWLLRRLRGTLVRTGPMQLRPRPQARSVGLRTKTPYHSRSSRSPDCDKLPAVAWDQTVSF